MTSLRHLASIVVLCAVAGCANWPDPVIPGTDAARAAPWPALVPLSDILVGGTQVSEPVVPSAARLAALTARAASLRGPVVDAATRARMARGVDLSALQGPR